jgi:hypothetical protein
MQANWNIALILALYGWCPKRSTKYVGIYPPAMLNIVIRYKTNINAMPIFESEE